MRQMFRPGDRLVDRYLVVRELGRGAMGIVFLANDLRYDRSVAVKVLNPDLSSSIAAERFKQEIAIAARLTHPHIVPLLDSAHSDGMLFYVMPYVEGDTLATRMSREGPLPLRTVLRIGRDIADALEFAHQHGVVHRDIKPENILVTARHAMVTDFGVARAIEAAADRKLTRQGSAVGTPAYMSPEQALGAEHVDARSDIYSLGCVLYEMLAGRPPHTGPGVRAVLMEKLLDGAPPLPDPGYRIPAELAELIETAIDRNPERRPASASRLIEALDHVSAVVSSPPARLASQSSGNDVEHRVSRRMVVATVLALLIGVVAAVYRFGWLTGSQQTTESMVVLPFQTAVSTAAADSLAAAFAAEMTRQLNTWEGVLAVSQVALSGPMFDLGLGRALVTTLEDARRIARAVRAGTIVGVSLVLRGDSMWSEVEMWDADSGRRVRRPMVHGGPVANLASIAASLTGEILGLGGAPEVLARLQRYSLSPMALSQFTRGEQLLAEWRLQEAEEHFRAAIVDDSIFALARHYLALTLYWQSASGQRSLATSGPEIVRQAATAVRQGVNLPEAERQHVMAFHAFQLGDYQVAREHYLALLERDPADVHAWLLLGGVEYSDPWLMVTPEGDTLPRRNLNEARRAFERTVRYSPIFHLGYGHLFEIHGWIASAAWLGEAQGFEVPRSTLIAPWEPRSPTLQRPYLPVVLDSIVWVDRAAFDKLDPALVAAGAQGLEDELVRLLNRWVAAAPDAIRPHEEMASWIIDELSRLRRAGRAMAPEGIEQKLRLALEHASAALALSRDTLPRDLFRLVDLHVALGEISEATIAAEAARKLRPGRPVDEKLAANLFMATGQVGRLLALDLAQGQQRYASDPEGGPPLPYGAASRSFERLRVLGAMGVGGPLLTTTLRQLSQAWAGPEYTDRQRAVLGDNAARHIAPALALDLDALRTWTDELDLTNPILHALLLAPTHPEQARDFLLRASDIDEEGPRDAQRTYLAGFAAQQLHEHERATRFLSRLDSLAPIVGAVDPAWGFRALSYALRAVSYDSLGDAARAEANRKRYLAVWAGADSLAASQVRLAAVRAAVEGRRATK